MKLIRKIIIEGKIKLLTGLHIGGSDQEIKIGGIDNSVIKTKDRPYIPGSSIKGKIRGLLEQKKGLEKPCDCGTCTICKLFGTSANKAVEPGRLIVRDSEPLGDDVVATEIKFENTINRITSKAENPRQTERVPAGNVFNFQIIFNDFGEDQEVFELLKKGLKFLENDYLGGSGTRGYGRITFIDLNQREVNEKETDIIEVSQIEDLAY
jgi:CRISPR-associated protein Csm3